LGGRLNKKTKAQMRYMPGSGGQGRYQDLEGGRWGINPEPSSFQLGFGRELLRDQKPARWTKEASTCEGLSKEALFAGGKRVGVGKA